MLKYLATRGLSMVPVLVLLSIGVFLMIHLTPGDPVKLMLGEDADAASVAALRAELGLDQPLPAQYLRWAWRALQGDLGRSIRTHQPVTEAIWQRLPVTIELSLLALLVAVVIGLPAGVVSAVQRNSIADVISTGFALLGISLPNFFLAILMILVFALWLGWAPSSGYTPFLQNPIENLKLMAMPAISLGAAFAAIVARLTRSSLLEVLAQDYVRTARAKGLAEPIVVGSHALRNALIPVVTVIGLQIGTLLGGAVLTETIFAIPGMGRLVVDNIFARDFPVVQGVVLFLAITRLATNLAADCVYALLDPRIAYD